MRRSYASKSYMAIALGAVAAAACAPAESRPPQAESSPSVEAVQARYGALPLSQRLTGTVRAAGQVAIYPEAAGPIVEVLVRNGDQVRAGDPLVRIRVEGSRSQLQQSEAGLASARAQRERAAATLADLERRYERSEPLAEENFISREELETLRTELAAARAGLVDAEARVRSAEAALDGSRETASQTVVRAPIDGTVGRRNAEIGMYATTSTALFTIGRLDEMEIDVPITQELLAKIRVGQTAEIQAEANADTVIVAEVSRVSPFIEPGSFSAEVQIDVDNPGGVLLPGMFVTVDIRYGESESATLLPKSALYEDPRTGTVGVYTMPAIGLEVAIDDPDAEAAPEMTPPTPAEFTRVEVLAAGRHVVGVSGIEPGTWVVTVGQHLLTGQRGEDGPRARVRPMTWERLIALQGLQREDYLRQFMEKQQRIARERVDSTQSSANVGGTTPAGV